MSSSITFWLRLEPQARDANMTSALQAQVRDPLWMLGRQWQVGEFLGHDAGSPVQASFRLEYAPLTGYRPKAGPGPAAASFDPGLPLEVNVERESVSLGLRASVQFGLYFEGLLRASSLSNVAQLIADFRTTYSLLGNSAGPSYDEVPDVAAGQFTAAVYGRVTDGQALYADARASLPNQPSKLPASAQAVFGELLPILQAFVSYCGSLYSQPNADAAWSPRPPDPRTRASDVGWLRYDFTVGSQSTMTDIAFQAPEFTGGHLDWYDFSATSDILDTGAPAQSTVEHRTLLPVHVTFRGMPTGSFWQFEDSLTDFGRLTTELTDLPAMLVAEFAVLYGGDWFTAPVQVPFGTVSRVGLLVVTDTFGQRTLVRRAGTVPGGQRPWALFTIAGQQTVADLLLLPPTLTVAQNGPALEVVDFLRDDAAALGWAVERTLQGPLDAPVDGYEWYLQRINRVPPPPPPQASPSGPEIYYLLGTTVPDNWIPLVPTQANPGAPPLLRRGAMVRLDPTQSPAAPVPVPPRGQILQPGYPTTGNPLFLSDQAVPQVGLQIQRFFRRTRWVDGSTHVWIARQVLPGRGPGASGLAFDLIKPMQP